MIKVVHIIPSLGRGGAERMLAGITRNPDGDVEHAIVTLLDEAPAFDFSPPVSSAGLHRRGVNLAGAIRLRAIVAQLQPDVVHAWLYHGCLATLFLRSGPAPVIWAIHNSDLDRSRSKWTTRAVARVCQIASGAVPAAIVYCAASSRTIHERMGYDRSKGRVIKNGVDMAEYAFSPAGRERLRTEIGLKGSELLFGCVARYDAQKGFETVASAFADLGREVPARLLLAGDGCVSQNEMLQRTLSRSSIADRTILLGPRADVAAVMSALDVLVIGSAYGEALPMVALEAACIGVHMVCTDVGDTPALMLDAALVAPPDDPPRLAAAMRHAGALVASGCGGALLENRRQLVLAQHNLTEVARQYHELYRALGRSA